jgi:hypothetical protein
VERRLEGKLSNGIDGDAPQSVIPSAAPVMDSSTPIEEEVSVTAFDIP